MNNFPYPAWWDATLTIYNKYENPLTNQITWFRSVLNNCFWKAAGNKVTMNNSELETDNITARIPKSPLFRDYGTWITIPNDQKSEYFTLTEGDIVVYGEVADEINEYQSGHRSNDLLKKYKKSGCMQIDGISLDVGTMRVCPHYWIKGK